MFSEDTLTNMRKQITDIPLSISEEDKLIVIMGSSVSHDKVHLMSFLNLIEVVSPRVTLHVNKVYLNKMSKQEEL
jgi:hypothetical protein